MSAKTTKRKSSQPQMRPEYDFSGGIRGKHYRRYTESSNVVVLDPDVHKQFRNADAVNEALRSLIRGGDTRQSPTKRSTRTRRTAARR
jgi:hypothetical protein